MIVEIVFFRIPAEISRAELMDKYRGTAKKWAENTDLARKYYFYDPETGRGGGVYIWKTMEAARRWHGQEYRDMIKKIYGSEPEIKYLDAMLHVNNEAGTVVEF